MSGKAANRVSKDLKRKGKNGSGNGKSSKGHTLVKRIEGEMKKALPKLVDPNRFVRMAYTTISQNPKLSKCTPKSLWGAFMNCAQLGLLPNVLGQAYILPYRNRRAGTLTANFIIGYKGMVDLTYRSGQVEDIAARLIYENDLVNFSYGREEDFKHVPWYLRDDKDFEGPGEWIAGYTHARLATGGTYLEPHPRADIMKRKKASQAGDAGPWSSGDTDDDWEEMMARKTCIRMDFGYLPVSTEAKAGKRLDENVREYDPETDSADAEVVEIASQVSNKSESSEENDSDDKSDAEDTREKKTAQSSGESSQADSDFTEAGRKLANSFQKPPLVEAAGDAGFKKSGTKLEVAQRLADAGITAEDINNGAESDNEENTDGKPGTNDKDKEVETEVETPGEIMSQVLQLANEMDLDPASIRLTMSTAYGGQSSKDLTAAQAQSILDCLEAIKNEDYQLDFNQDGGIVLGPYKLDA